METKLYEFGIALTALQHELKRVKRYSWESGEYIFLKQGHPVDYFMNDNHIIGDVPFAPHGTKQDIKHRQGQMIQTILKCKGDKSESWGVGYADYTVWFPTHEDLFATNLIIL